MLGAIHGIHLSYVAPADIPPLIVSLGLTEHSHNPPQRNVHQLRRYLNKLTPLFTRESHTESFR